MTEAVIMLRKSMDWFLYDNGPRHEIVNINVLGKFPPRKIAPSPNSNANPKPNPDSYQGAIFWTPLLAT